MSPRARELLPGFNQALALASSLSRNMGGLAEYESGRFRLPKSLQEDSLFAQSNTKSTEYKDKWVIEVFRNWQAVREQKFPSVDTGSVLKDYDVHRVQSRSYDSYESPVAQW